MTELPEEAIEVAEELSVDHSHDALGGGADSLLEHLRREHNLDTPDDLSSSTLDGVHDRLHADADAAAE